jgi:hypothetical protein
MLATLALNRNSMNRYHIAAPSIAATSLIMPPPEEAGTRVQINFTGPLSQWVDCVASTQRRAARQP